MREQGVGERWEPAPGYAGFYEVSNQARVKRLARCAANGQWYPEIILAQCSNGRAGQPYRCVQLRGTDGQRHWCKVYRLVAQAFLGQRLPGMHTLHGPGGPLDDWLVNLSYGTPVQNAQDQVRDGTQALGDKMPHARLSEEIVRDSRRRYGAGEKAVRLAVEAGVSETTMGRALSGKTWQWVR